MVASMIGGIVAAGLALPAIGASRAITQSSLNYLESLPVELTVAPQAEITKVLAADGSLITTFYDQNRDIQELADISPHLRSAVVAIEDSRFYEHSGVDARGILRAAAVNQLAGRSAQGASTLTQQYVKNVLIEAAVAAGDQQAAREARRKDAARKIQEMRYAAALEQELPKDIILQRYLNITFFGRTLYGAEAAARHYFGTSAKDLTLPQAATLAGMIQQPGAFNPQKYPERALRRRNVVLARMFELGRIDREVYEEARATPLGTNISPTPNGCANARRHTGYYCEYVRRLLVGSQDFSALGATPAEREAALLRGGLTIRTAMDPKIMKAAWKAVTRAVPPKDKSDVAAATVTVEAGTGKLLAIQQNKTYGIGERRSGLRSLSYAVDREWGGGNGFPTGSTFKPFTLAAWLSAGKSLNARVRSSGATVPFSSFTACGSPLPGKGNYTYSNADEGRTDNARMSVWDGTAGSVNGVYVSMEQQLDLCDIRKTAEGLGVHLAAAREDVCGSGARTTRLPICVPSLTLGVESISPMTMAGAYATFAAGGRYCEPTAVLEILDRRGEVLPVPGPNCRRALDKQVANAVNLGLSRVLTDGTAGNVGPLPGGRPASGKTGTTNNSIDTWFVGYTRQLATSVWVGDPFSHTRKGKAARRSLNGRTIGGERYPNVYGATLAGPIWKDIMIAASKGTKIKSFPRPSAKYTVSPQKKVPDVRGHSSEEAATTLKKAGFRIRFSREQVESTLPQGSVASTSPGPGVAVELGSTITIKISAGPPEPEVPEIDPRPDDDLTPTPSDDAEGGASTPTPAAVSETGRTGEQS